MKTYNRKAIFSELKDYCTFAKDNDYAEICMWANEEGFDVEIDSTLKTRIQLTWGQWKLLKKMVKKLNRIETDEE